ncbi:cysteine surface protein, putative, partial [Entamoeba invadens IP1]
MLGFQYKCYIVFILLIDMVVSYDQCNLTSPLSTNATITSSCSQSNVLQIENTSTQVILKIMNNAEINLDDILNLKTNSNLIMIDSSSLIVVQQVAFKNNSIILMQDNTVFKCRQMTTFFNTAHLTMDGKSVTNINTNLQLYSNSKIEMKGYSKIYTEYPNYINDNSIFILEGNSNFTSKGSISFNNNVSLTMKNMSLMHMYSYITFLENSNLFVKDNSQIQSGSQFKCSGFFTGIIEGNAKITANIINFDKNSRLYCNGNSELISFSTLSVYENSFISLKEKAKMKVLFSLLMYNSSSINLNGNAKVTVTKSSEIANGIVLMSDNSFINTPYFNMHPNGKLVLDGVNGIPTVNCSSFVCSQGIVNITYNSIIYVDTSTNMNNCNFFLTNRTIRDFPLFFVNSFNLADNNYVTNNWNFDLVYSKTPVVSASQTNLLLDGHLYRNGNSKKIFCHLNQFDSTTNTMSYTEPYCPCEDKEDWYITPFANITFLKITVDSTKNYKNKNIKKVDDDFTDESATIGNTQISFFKTNNMIVQITSKISVKLELYSLTKKVLFISETKLVYGNVKYNTALNTKNGIKIISGVECGNGLYNKSSQQCHILNDCDVSNCKYCPNDRSVCEVCQSTYELIDGNCIKNENCLFSTSNWCKKCLNGFYMKNGNCEKVTDCNVIKIDGTCQICENNNKKMLNLNGECIESDKTKVETTSDTNINTCKNGYFLNINICEKCVNSSLCENGRVTKCDTNNEMSINRNCDIKNCEIPNDTNGRCNKEIINCTILTNAKCEECDNNFILSQNKCENRGDIRCEVQNSIGCIKCKDSYFYDKNTKNCEKCDSTCLTCFDNETTCLSCKSGMYLSDYKCNTNKDLQVKCLQFASFGSGCVVCKDGYYRVGLDCFECDLNCETCNDKKNCYTCNKTNYKTNGGDCLPQGGIVGCAVNVTQSGCSKCQDGYYLVNTNECNKCDDNCNTCTTTGNKCTSCVNSLV